VFVLDGPVGTDHSILDIAQGGIDPFGLVVTPVPKVTLRNLLNINGVFERLLAQPLDKKGNPAFLQLETRFGLTLKQTRPKASWFKGQTAS
jgi:hypothetical protein